MPSTTSRSCRSVLALGLLAGLATVLLHVRSLAFPILMVDDFEILEQSWTWERTWQGLWRPQNEHAMPLGRLLTFGLEQLAGRLTALPHACSLVGPLALLLALPLLYVLVRRELGHPLFGLTAVILFGVSSVYNQSVYWFAASYSILSLDTLLLALLAAQRWRQTRRPLFLAAGVVLTALAPAWFGIGILAGPLVMLYLLGDCVGADGRQGRAARVGASLLPLAGSALFLAVSLPRTASYLNHLPHNHGQTMLECLGPATGLGYTLRALADGLFLGAFGITDVALPVWAVAVLVPLLGVLAWRWCRPAASLALLGLGLGLIGASYLLVYTARARWDYPLLAGPTFNRYHLLPQLGLALLICTGLAGRARRPMGTQPGWLVLSGDGTLSRRQVRGLAVLLAVCLIVQLPRGLLCCYASRPRASDLERFRQASALGRLLLAGVSEQEVDTLAEQDEQQAVLEQVEQVDAFCRQHHIRAADARAALPELDIPGSAGRVNGWDFLRGSATPQDWSADQLRHLLREKEELTAEGAEAGRSHPRGHGPAQRKKEREESRSDAANAEDEPTEDKMDTP